jgi:hypothetical protein
MKGLVVSALIVLAAASCKPARDPIVGTWKGSMGGSEVTVTFGADKTFTRSGVAKMMGAPITFTLSGTYDLAGDKVTFNPTDAKVSGFGSDESNHTLEDSIRKSNLKPGAGTIKRNGDDAMAMTITQNGLTETVNLSRQK